MALWFSQNKNTTYNAFAFSAISGQQSAFGIRIGG